MSSRTLQQCLINCDPTRLEAIARSWGLDGLPGRRREAVATLTERMLAPGELELLWATLPADQQAALAALQAAGGTTPWPTFARRWGQVRAMGPGRMAREQPWEASTSPAEGLWYRGLVCRTFVAGPTGLHEMAFIPDELRGRLPMPPAPPPSHLEPIGAPSITLPATDHLLDDGCTLLAYLQTHRVRPGPEGEWPARDETALAHRLRDPDPDRLDFLRHLAHRAGWLRTDRAGRLRPDPSPAADWLQAPAQKQRAALAAAWRDDPAWNDLWHVPTLHPDDTGSWHNDPLLARQAVLRHLSACRPGAWYALDAFTAAVKEADPDFQRPDGDYDNWYIRDAVSGEYVRGFESWEVVEGALIHYLLTGPMAWPGLMDLGAEREGDQPVAFRLSLAGAAFLGLAEPELEQEPPPLVIRPDLTVLAPAVRRYDRFQLSRVADWVRTGDPYVYRLTASSLAKAQQQGITPQRVMAFLERATGGDVPRTLATALGRWSRHGAEVQLEQGVLLRVQDEELLQRLTTSPTTRRFIRETVGPTTALVAPADWPRLARALVEEGLLPDVVGLESEWETKR